MGGVLGEQQGVAPGRDYDDELLFLGCLLHDVGLGDHGSGDQPFDIDGADLAAGWLRDQGVAPDRVEVGLLAYCHARALRVVLRATRTTPEERPC